MPADTPPAPDAALREKLKALMATAMPGGLHAERVERDRFHPEHGHYTHADPNATIFLVEPEGDAAEVACEVPPHLANIIVALVNNLPTILAALSRDGGADGWRSIESAPKPGRDGEKIDVWLEPIPERQKYFSNPDHGPGRRLVNAWWTERADYVGYRNDESYNGRELNYRATHWRPLPAPPAAQKEEGT